jgi:hypothetical protein
MSTFGESIALNTAKAFLIGEGDTERFAFKKFDGRLLKAYVANGDEYPEEKIERVALKINPSEVQHQQPRMTQKVQTNLPGRFVIFDWGVDLHSMNIRGNTGNLLPDAVQGGLDPFKNAMDTISSKIVPVSITNRSTQEALSYGSEAILGNLSYFEILNMSPKYRTFVKLQKLYLGFDADTDVCTLEFGDFVYRIFFIDFTFTQSAESPWNWTYEIQLNVLSDLTEFSRKGDDSFANNLNVDNAR